MGGVEIGGVVCGIRDYDKKKNLFTVSSLIHSFNQKELDEFIGHKWVFHEKDAKRFYLPSSK